jgi:hypothetical protein
MHSPDTRDFGKLVEDSLHSRVNGAREALLNAKLNFRRAHQYRHPDRDIQREREAMAARAQARAVTYVVTAVRDLHAFITDGSVPKNRSAEEMKICLQYNTDQHPTGKTPGEVKKREHSRMAQTKAAV